MDMLPELAAIPYSFAHDVLAQAAAREAHDYIDLYCAHFLAPIRAVRRRVARRRRA
jgi:hypothetical protein